MRLLPAFSSLEFASALASPLEFASALASVHAFAGLLVECAVLRAETIAPAAAARFPALCPASSRRAHWLAARADATDPSLAFEAKTTAPGSTVAAVTLTPSLEKRRPDDGGRRLAADRLPALFPAPSKRTHWLASRPSHVESSSPERCL